MLRSILGAALLALSASACTDSSAEDNCRARAPETQGAVVVAFNEFSFSDPELGRRLAPPEGWKRIAVDDVRSTSIFHSERIYFYAVPSDADFAGYVDSKFVGRCIGVVTYPYVVNTTDSHAINIEMYTCPGGSDASLSFEGENGQNQCALPGGGVVDAIVQRAEGTAAGQISGCSELRIRAMNDEMRLDLSVTFEDNAPYPLAGECTDDWLSE